MKSHFFHLVIAFVICGVALIGYGFWYTAVSAKSAAVANIQSQIVAKKETITRAASARVTLTEISGAQATLQNYFVPETGVVSFIDGLELEGKTLRTTVNVLSVSTGSSKTQPTLSFSLTIKGTFDAVLRTVGAIEYAPYDISVSGFSLMQDGKDNWQADLNLSVGSMTVATSTSL